MRNLSKSSKIGAESHGRSLPFAILSGVLIACALTCVTIIVCALLLTYTTMTEGTLPLIITVACVVSSLAAGFSTARHADDKGWMWGVCAGGIYAVILVVVEMCVQKRVSLDMRTITLIVLALAGGGLGGMLGINFKK